MKHLPFLLSIALLTACAKEPPAPPAPCTPCAPSMIAAPIQVYPLDTDTPPAAFVTLSWEAVTEAVMYEVETNWHGRVFVIGYTHWGASMDGTTAWRVRAIDIDDNAGRWSPWIIFTPSP
jgi:hypothetical protein